VGVDTGSWWCKIGTNWGNRRIGGGIGRVGEVGGVGGIGGLGGLGERLLPRVPRVTRVAPKKDEKREEKMQIKTDSESSCEVKQVMKWNG
jgi:hypothetical protein